VGNNDIDPVCDECRSWAELHQHEYDENITHRNDGRKLRQSDVNCGYKDGNDGEENPLNRKNVTGGEAKEGERNSGNVNAEQV